MMIKNKYRNGVTLLLFLIVTLTLILIAGFRPVGFDNDSHGYQEALDFFQHGFFPIKEPTFIFSLWLSDFIFDSSIHSVFFFYAIIAICTKMTVIYKYSAIPVLSLVIYICVFYILHDLTQIRVGVAAAFFISAIPDLIAGKRKIYMIKIAVAVLFHFSAIILFLFSFISNKRIKLVTYFLLPFLTLIFVLLIGDMNALLLKFFNIMPAPIGPKAVGYIINLQLYGRFDNVNIFSKFSLCVIMFFVIYTIALVKSMSRVNQNVVNPDIIYFKIISIMLTVFYILSSVPVLASRTFELFGVSLIFALPTLALRIRQEKFAMILLVVWSMVYLYIVNIKLLNFDML